MEEKLIMEVRKLRKKVLSIIIDIDTNYSATDTDTLKSKMSEKEWELYSLLNKIECDLHC